MLLRSIIFELKRSFREPNFKLSLFISLSIVVIDFVTFRFHYFGGTDGVILIQAWIGTDFQFAYNYLFYVLFPVIACMSYSGSFHQDVFSGYDKNILLKISRSNYMIAKIIAIYFSAFVSIAIPLLISLFLVAGFYPNYLPQRLTFLVPGIIDCYRFPVIFAEKPLLYCLLFILIDASFAGVLGLIAFAISKWCRSSFEAIMFPFCFYIITSSLLTDMDGNSLGIMMMVNPVQDYITTLSQMVISYIVLLILSICLIGRIGRKRDVL